jgi:hypothetical protein
MQFSSPSDETLLAQLDSIEQIVINLKPKVEKFAEKKLRFARLLKTTLEQVLSLEQDAVQPTRKNFKLLRDLQADQRELAQQITEIGRDIDEIKQIIEKLGDKIHRIVMSWFCKHVLSNQSTRYSDLKAINNCTDRFTDLLILCGLTSEDQSHLSAEILNSIRSINFSKNDCDLVDLINGRGAGKTYKYFIQLRSSSKTLDKFNTNKKYKIVTNDCIYAMSCFLQIENIYDFMSNFKRLYESLRQVSVEFIREDISYKNHLKKYNEKSRSNDTKGLSNRLYQIDKKLEANLAISRIASATEIPEDLLKESSDNLNTSTLISWTETELSTE